MLIIGRLGGAGVFDGADRRHSSGVSHVSRLHAANIWCDVDICDRPRGCTCHTDLSILLCTYLIHSNRRPFSNRRPPPSSSSTWHTNIGEIDDFFYQECVDLRPDLELIVMYQLHVLLTFSPLLLEWIQNFHLPNNFPCSRLCALIHMTYLALRFSFGFFWPPKQASKIVSSH